MSLSDEQRYQRAIVCNEFHLPQVDTASFLRVLKDDWNMRALHDPSSFVFAEHEAPEELIRESGRKAVLLDFVPRLKNYPHDTILEIGCGMGRMSIFICEYASRYYGVDISGELIKIAMRRLAVYREECAVTGKVCQETFVETDGMSLGDAIPPNSVDFAFEFIVFQHISSQDVIMSYIRDVHRVLKQGGVFVMHGRDISTGISGASEGNTWHGTRSGPELVRRAIHGLSFTIVEEEGQNTVDYWVTLQKTQL